MSFVGCQVYRLLGIHMLHDFIALRGSSLLDFDEFLIISSHTSLIGSLRHAFFISDTTSSYYIVYHTFSLWASSRESINQSFLNSLVFYLFNPTLISLPIHVSCHVATVIERILEVF